MLSAWAGCALGCALVLGQAQPHAGPRELALRACIRSSCAALARTPFPLAAACAHAAPRARSVEAQMRYAIDCKQHAWSASAAGEAEARRAAIAAFRAVRLHFPAQRSTCAEAAFRAGELWRAAGRPGLAALEFGVAIELGAKSEFRSRARIELGHLARRAGELAQAQALFEVVALDAGAAARWRDEASLAIGRLHAATVRHADARRWLRRVAEQSGDVLLRVRAYDAWAITYVDEDDVEAAAGVLALARNALDDVAQEATELGERVAAALERMSCIGHMQRALEARRRASERNRRD